MINLCSCSFTLTPNDSRTHKKLNFEIPDSTSGLYIYFKYRPKLLEDKKLCKSLIFDNIQKYVPFDDDRKKLLELYKNDIPCLCNLITLSLDSPYGFKGAAHRHNPNQEIKIEKNNASYGFIPGTEPGVWTLTLSVHLIITSFCKADISIFIY